MERKSVISTYETSSLQNTLKIHSHLRLRGLMAIPLKQTILQNNKRLLAKWNNYLSNWKVAFLNSTIDTLIRWEWPMICNYANTSANKTTDVISTAISGARDYSEKK